MASATRWTGCRLERTERRGARTSSSCRHRCKTSLMGRASTTASRRGSIGRAPPPGAAAQRVSRTRLDDARGTRRTRDARAVVRPRHASASDKSTRLAVHADVIARSDYHIHGANERRAQRYERRAAEVDAVTIADGRLLVGALFETRACRPAKIISTHLVRFTRSRSWDTGARALSFHATTLFLIDPSSASFTSPPPPHGACRRSLRRR